MLRWNGGRLVTITPERLAEIAGSDCKWPEGARGLVVELVAEVRRLQVQVETVTAMYDRVHAERDLLREALAEVMGATCESLNHAAKAAYRIAEEARRDV